MKMVRKRRTSGIKRMTMRDEADNDQDDENEDNDNVFYTMYWLL
jgi:hypothetical protein